MSDASNSKTFRKRRSVRTRRKPLLAVCGSKPLQTGSSGFRIDDLVKLLAAVTVVATVLGYILTGENLKGYGISPITTVNSRVISAGLIALFLLCSPCVPVVLLWQRHRRNSVRAKLGSRYEPPWLTWARLGVALQVAVYFAFSVANLAADVVLTQTAYHTWGISISVVALMTIEGVSFESFLEKSRQKDGQARAGAIRWFSLAALSMVLIGLYIYHLCNSPVPIRRAVAWSVIYAGVLFLVLHFKETEVGVPLLIFGFIGVGAVQGMSSVLFDFMHASLGGGAFNPISVTFFDKLDQCERTIRGRDVYDTDAYIYLAPGDSGHCTQLIAKNDVRSMASSDEIGSLGSGEKVCKNDNAVEKLTCPENTASQPDRRKSASTKQALPISFWARVKKWLGAINAETSWCRQ